MDRADFTWGSSYGELQLYFQSRNDSFNVSQKTEKEEMRLKALLQHENKTQRVKLGTLG